MPVSAPPAPHFRVSPAVLGPLGVEQLQDPALAVLELIKNSWDADAKSVSVIIDQRRGRNQIVVRDNGHGMSEAEFRDRWLVIGNSYKRGRPQSEKGRPLIGEKGLGRLASFALGERTTIKSGRSGNTSFAAVVDWAALARASSLEDYIVSVKPSGKGIRGTTVVVDSLRKKWADDHTAFLITHAQFLASVPGHEMEIDLRVNGRTEVLEDPEELIQRLSQGSIEIKVGRGGTPRVVACEIEGVDESAIVFRKMKPSELDPRLEGTRLKLQFLLRDRANKELRGILGRTEATATLERYQGVRIYRDGINVPPYGLGGDDWAGLEKQRTSTGGPTLVPGNSQLVGEVHVARKKQPHLVITAGRSGFTDQTAVASLASYVRWTVKALGTARRAHHFGITGKGTPVPARVDDPQRERGAELEDAADVLSRLESSPAVRANTELAQQVTEATAVVRDSLGQAEKTLRLYAQLASTGIAATSFAHELRAEFDVVSDAIEELTDTRKRLDQELLDLLNESWSRIQSFAALFKVIPVKIRRDRQILDRKNLELSIAAILELAPPDKVTTVVSVEDLAVSVVPAELDSILLNLVSNAVKAIAESRNRDRGKLRVCYEAKGSDLLMRVADNGVGVTSNVSAIMFEPLEGKFAEGTGMGLPIVKYIAGRYGGDVIMTAPSQKGFVTEFTVVLRKVVAT